MYLIVILLPLLGAIVSGFFGRIVGTKGAQIITSISILITTLMSILLFIEVGLNDIPVSIYLCRWLESEWFNIGLSFQFDSLTVSMLIPVLIVSTLVHVYSIKYMNSDPHNQRFFSYLSLFTFMMIILVTADNYLLMFVGWEGVGVCSYLLVNFWFTRIAANQSSISAFLTNRVGDCILTIGMFIILWSIGNLDYATVFSMSPYINENIVFIIGICLLFGAMAKSVRRCALFWNGEEFSKHWPIVFLTTELDIKESLMLNWASLINGGIRPKQEGWVALPVNIPMIKAILLEVYLPVVSSHGLQLACDRLGAAISYFVFLSGNTVCPQTNCINNFKVESRQSKGINIQNIGTSRLPKAENSYGNRGIVVLGYVSIYSPSKIGARGRIPDFNIRRLSTSAGSPVQSKSDTSEKLLKLREHCKNNPDGLVNLEKIYRLMYDPMLYHLAYRNLTSNPGNMTPTLTTLDGRSMEVIEGIINKLKDGSFKYSSKERPKSSEGTRPLIIASSTDKLVLEVMRMLLEAIFEPTFSDNSHGFRSGRSCHTALKRIKETFGLASWYIEGDISKCFDSFDHKLLMQIIEKRIKDKRFTDLIRKALKAGYMEFEVLKYSISGTPQGSIISPILSNIYLNELDKFVESLKAKFDTGSKPKINPAYNRLRYLKSKQSNPETKARIHKLLLKTHNALHPSFKKIMYVRYADDWILGVRGSKEDCRVLLDKIKTFLKKDLNLVLSENKTLITNANEDKAMFLGTEIFRRRHQSFSSSQFGFINRNAKEVRLQAPKQKILNKLADVGFLGNNEPVPRFLWLANDKDNIIYLYNSVYRGYINYYSFAENLNRISSLIYFTLKTSCAKLLAAKFKLETKSKVFAIFGSNMKGKDTIGFADPLYGMNAWDFKINSKETIPTMFAKSLSKVSLLDLKCAICDSDYRVEMHRIRMMKYLNPKISKVDTLMAKRNRKQIPLCRKCHMVHHHRKGNYNNNV